MPAADAAGEAAGLATGDAAAAAGEPAAAGEAAGLASAGFAGAAVGDAGAGVEHAAASAAALPIPSKRNTLRRFIVLATSVDTPTPTSHGTKTPRLQHAGPGHGQSTLGTIYCEMTRPRNNCSGAYRVYSFSRG